MLFLAKKNIVSAAVMGLMAMVFLLPFLSLLPIEAISDADYLLFAVKKLAIAASLSLVITVISGLIGGSSAVLLSFFAVPGRRLLVILYSAPIVVPSYIIAMLYADISSRFYSAAGYVFVMSAIGSSYFFLFVYGRCSNISSEMIGGLEALGLSWRIVFSKCILPTIRPAVVLSSLITYAESFNEFGSAYFLGVDTAVVLIYKLWFSSGQVADAKLLAFTASLLSLGAVLLGGFLVKPSVYNLAMTNKIRKPFALPRFWRLLLWPLLIAWPSLFVLVPFGVLIKWSFMVSGHFKSKQLWPVLFDTIGMAVGCSLIIVLICLALIELIKVKQLKKLAWIINNNYFLPGIVIAIAVLAVGDYLPGWDRLAWLPFVLAIVLKYSAMGLNSLLSMFEHLNPGYRSVVLLFGKSEWWYLWRVKYQLLYRGLVLTVLITALEIIKELPITLALRPFGFETFSTKAFYYASEEMLYLAAPWIILIILASVIISLAIKALSVWRWK